MIPQIPVNFPLGVDKRSKEAYSKAILEVYVYGGERRGRLSQ